jgi:hypothetical protein
VGGQLAGEVAPQRLLGMGALLGDAPRSLALGERGRQLIAVSPGVGQLALEL